MPTVKPVRSRYFVPLWVAGFLAAMTAGAIAVNRFDLGWASALLVMLVAVGMIVPLIRATEHSAAAKGDLSLAMRRYNRRIIVSTFLYTITLFAAIYIHAEWKPSGLVPWVVGFLPSLGVLAMIAAMARLLIEEEDEYLRLKFAHSTLFATAVLLTVATVWGFLEQFDLVPHVPAWAAVPIFVVMQGLARCSKWGRA